MDPVEGTILAGFIFAIYFAGLFVTMSFVRDIFLDDKKPRWYRNTLMTGSGIIWPALMVVVLASGLFWALSEFVKWIVGMYKD